MCTYVWINKWVKDGWVLEGGGAFLFYIWSRDGINSLYDLGLGRY